MRTAKISVPPVPVNTFTGRFHHITIHPKPFITGERMSMTTGPHLWGIIIGHAQRHTTCLARTSTTTCRRPSVYPQAGGVRVFAKLGRIAPTVLLR